MNVRLIKTKADHEAALKRIDAIFDARPGTAEGDELELLLHLVEEFEDTQYPIAMPDPIDALKFRMEQQGLKQADLVPYIGSKSKVSEVLNHRRPLSLAMIRKLHSELGIPAEVLVQKPGMKTNFDSFLEKQRQDPDFGERFEKAGEAWDIAVQLAALREAQGLSQKELARRVGTTQQQISRLESPSYEGHSLSMLRRVAEALGAHVHVTLDAVPRPHSVVAESRAEYGRKRS